MKASMNVLHINQSDIHGGAALAAYRIHRGLLEAGVESNLLVGKKSSRDERVDIFPQKYKLAWIGEKISNFFALNYAFLPKVSLHSFNVFHQADIVHLHNLHTGYLNYRHLPEMLKGKKVVITLHDEWTYTGHCSYTHGCQRFQTGCGNCPFLDTYPSIRWDNTRMEWRLKQKVFEKLQPVVHCPSRWMAQQAQHSFLGKYSVQTVPLGLDLEIFRPLPRSLAKKALGFEENDVIVGFGAFELDDWRKGGDIFLSVIKRIKNLNDINLNLLLIGQGNTKHWRDETGLKVFSTGYVHDGPLKTLAYSVCDVFVVPSREDSFNLMALEAQACGVGVIASNVGGLSDNIEHQVTGLLVDVNDLDAWENALFELLTNSEKRVHMGIMARRRVETLFDIKLTTERMIELYRGALT